MCVFIIISSLLEVVLEYPTVSFTVSEVLQLCPFYVAYTL